MAKRCSAAALSEHLTARPLASWFETRGVAARLTMRV